MRRAIPYLIGVLIPALVAIENWPRSRTVSLELSGPAGQKVSGTYTVNGVAHLYNGVLPARIEARASRFTYALWSPQGLKGTLAVDGRELGGSTSDRSSLAVTGETEFSGYLRPVKWTKTSVLELKAFEWALRNFPAS
jgi:hypothetical protein